MLTCFFFAGPWPVSVSCCWCPAFRRLPRRKPAHLPFLKAVPQSPCFRLVSLFVCGKKNMSATVINKLSASNICAAVRVIRRQRIIFDADLARFYGVTTKRLNEAVKRDRDRFPEDFAFQLSKQEYTALRYMPSVGKSEPAAKETDATMWSQFATTSAHPLRIQIAPSKRRMTNPPIAFTEHGVIMAATIMKSKRAIERSVLWFALSRRRWLNDWPRLKNP